MTPRTRQFASDNCAGICPEAWAAMAEANQGHVRSYGDDEWTAKAADMMREIFETQCEVYFVFNGTSANALAVSSLCQSYHSAICHEVSHLETDECGAPEFFSNGVKILTVDTPDGRVTPESIERLVSRRTDIHFPKPRMVSITNATEVGTVYTPEQVSGISHSSRKQGLHLHMDGARLSNAIATLGCKPRQITWQAGVDVLSFGGAKNGLAAGEAVIFFNTALAHEFDYRCKQAGQLCSKMRFLAAPWVGLLQSGAWLRNAQHANAMAERLEKAIAGIPGIRVMFPREANAVFVSMPPAARQKVLDKGWIFFTFIGHGGCRLMCAWDTTEEDVDAFAADIAEAMGGV
ncbi:MAG: low specificity L-threonine aldolase [Tepidisphaeraceae bacterium]|jgi:threonine aldolase